MQVVLWTLTVMAILTNAAGLIWNLPASIAARFLRKGFANRPYINFIRILVVISATSNIHQMLTDPGWPGNTVSLSIMYASFIALTFPGLPKRVMEGGNSGNR